MFVTTVLRTGRQENHKFKVIFTRSCDLLPQREEMAKGGEGRGGEDEEEEMGEKYNKRDFFH